MHLENRCIYVHININININIHKYIYIYICEVVDSATGRERILFTCE